MDDQLEAANSHIASLVSDAESRQQQTTDLIERLETANDMHMDLERQLLVANAMVADLSGKLSLSLDEGGAIQSQADAAQRQASLLESELELEISKGAELAETNAKLENDLQACQGTIVDMLEKIKEQDFEGKYVTMKAEAEAWQKKCQTAITQASDSEKLCEASRVEMSDLKASLSAAHAHSDSLTRSLQSATIAREAVEKASAERQTENETIAASIRLKLQEARDQLEVSQAEIAVLHVTLSSSQRESELRQNRCTQLEGDLEAAQRRITTIENDGDNLREQMQLVKSELHNTRMSFDEQEQALAERCRVLQADLQASRDQGQRALDQCAAATASMVTL